MSATSLHMFRAFVAFCLAVAPALATAGPINCQAESEPAIVDALAQALSRYVRELKRPIAFYHWAWRGPISQPLPGLERESRKPRRLNFDESIDLRGADGTYSGPADLRPSGLAADGSRTDVLAAYFQSLAAQFAAVGADERQWNAGAAYYVAPDPVASVSFSGDPGVLIELTAPAGTRYLDARSFSIFPVVSMPEAFRRWAAQKIAACEPRRPDILDDLRGPGFNLRALLWTPATRAPLVEALRRLRVDAVATSWGRSPFAECDAGDSRDGRTRGTALAFIDPGFLNRGATLQAFVSELDANPSPEKRDAYARILRALRAYQPSLRRYGGNEPEAMLAALQRFIEPWSRALGDSPGLHDASVYFGCAKDPRFREEASLLPFAAMKPLRE